MPAGLDNMSVDALSKVDNNKLCVIAKNYILQMYLQ